MKQSPVHSTVMQITTCLVFSLNGRGFASTCMYSVALGRIVITFIVQVIELS